MARLAILYLLFVLAASLAPPAATAQERLVRLSAPQELAETGLFKHILPRFSLKTQVRVEVVAPGDPAEAALSSAGQAVFEGAGQVWHLQILAPEHAGAERFSQWLTSDVGLRAVTGFAPEGTALFALAPDTGSSEEAEIAFEGDAARGLDLAHEMCGRCHIVSDRNRMSSIGSTPSFAVLRTLEGWEYRFQAFYALNPHPAFTQVDEVTEPFPEDRPSPIVPLEMTLDELDAILAFVAQIDPADLGAPLQHK